MAEVKTIGNIYNNIIKGLQMGKTLIALQGSARSGKTRNSVIFLIQCALSQKVHISIVRASLPVLKRSVFRDDFMEVLLQMGIWEERRMNKTEMTYTFPNGSIVEFFATDGPEGAQKARGPGRDILFCNEANEIEEENFKQMRMRTRKFVLLDFNPSFTEEHWLFKMLSDPRTYHFISTFADNPFLPDVIREEILSYKYTNPALWQIFGEGKFAIVEGLVFPKDTWDTFKMDELPIYVKEHRMGIDFGYSCASKGTLIETIHGQVPIEDVGEGDYVLTRKGYKRVVKNLYRGVKEVTRKEITINGVKTELAFTPDHKFKTFGKWKKYEALTKKDNLFVLSNLTEKCTNATPMANTQTTTITSGKKKAFTTKKCCIMLFGSVTMGQFLMDMLSITRITIRLTMTSVISCLSRLLNTVGFTSLSRLMQRQSEQEKSASQRATGMSADRLSKPTCGTSAERANVAEKSLLQPIHTSDSAQTNATTNGNIQRLKTMLKQLVVNVEKRFYRTSISNRNAAHRNAPTYSLGAINEIRDIETYRVSVYDLSIEGCHEFFANGVLVHNCDPTAVVETWTARVDGVRHLWINELVYERGLKTKQIANRLRNYNDLPKYSESADPRLIDEIEDEGISMLYPVKKFAGSLIVGIQKMQGYKIHISSTSSNLQKEMRNYCWQKDRHGNWMNVPIDKFNHAIDAVRYAIADDRSNVQGTFFRKEDLGLDF